MKKSRDIILASGSVQRKRLLQQLGLTFSVRRSHADEYAEIRSSCAKLVKDNALLKAREVAKKYPHSVVIGADTVVYGGGRSLILKPKDHADARRILRQLFSRPHWVYTGVAVLDVSRGIELLDFEKTKVFMTPLSDEEIRRYHEKVDPFDKAGGFDIEGWGSAFIHRIEGCYSNVIGLPIAKLVKMLKRAEVSVLSLVMAVFLGGCASQFNLATNQQEYSMYSTEREVNIGMKVAQRVEEEFGVYHGVEENERVERILEDIVAVSDRKEIVYHVRILDKEHLNAFALPGGYLFVFRGLLEAVETNDQLAGVIAHEVAHITTRHGIKRLENSYKAMALQVTSVAAAPEIAGGVSLALNSLFFEHSQLAEYEADKLAVKYMRAAGYNPEGLTEFLGIMRDEKDKEGPRPYSYWRTHPHLPERTANLNRHIKGRIEFRDYLNLTDPEENFY